MNVLGNLDKRCSVGGWREARLEWVEERTRGEEVETALSKISFQEITQEEEQKNKVE